MQRIQMKSSDAMMDELGCEQLATRLANDGVSRAHAPSLFRWLQTGRQTPFEGPLERWLINRENLFTSVELIKQTTSEDSYTRKFLLRLSDGAEIESVLMGFPGRYTACLSTQVGCAMGCVFCATGQMGFKRHLTSGEILAQARFLAGELRSTTGESLRNLVMMGMGEPLHNYAATIRALDLITDTRGLNIGAGRVTISTVGHVDGILKLARHPKPYTLAVSLHGATDEQRAALIPIHKRWPLGALMDTCREYTSICGRKVFVAWTLIGGVNDSADQARQLVELLRGMCVHVNLIPLNPTDGYEGKAPAWDDVVSFQRILRDAGLPATVRQRRGIDVSAGCGQLATRPK